MPRRYQHANVASTPESYWDVGFGESAALAESAASLPLSARESQQPDPLWDETPGR